MQQMTAMSLVQPWGELIVTGKKNIENRSWKTKKRGYVAIHASRSKDRKRFERCREEFRLLVDPEDVDFGAVIGFAELVDIVDEETVSKKSRKWLEDGNYGFVFENVVRLDEPVEVLGHMGFWTLEGDALEECLAQLPKRQRKIIEANKLF